MSDLEKAIIYPSGEGKAISPPGRLEPLSSAGEVFPLDGFWRWARGQGLVIINDKPGAAEAFERAHSGMKESEEQEKERSKEAEFEAAVEARLREETQRTERQLRARDERIAKLEAELAARAAAKPVDSEVTEVESPKAEKAKK